MTLTPLNAPLNSPGDIRHVPHSVTSHQGPRTAFAMVRNVVRRSGRTRYRLTPIAEIVEQLKDLLSLYQGKYDYDMSSMQEDILSLREPIFAVRPSTAFGLDEKATLNTATRWQIAP